MSKTKAYVASRFARRDEAAKVAQQLRDSGEFIIVSTWHDGIADAVGVDNGDTPSEEMELMRQEVSIKDVDEVALCEVLVSLTEKPGTAWSSGNRHIEFGVAYALNKICCLIGPRELMFHRLPVVFQFDTVETMLKAWNGPVNLTDYAVVPGGQ